MHDMARGPEGIASSSDAILADLERIEAAIDATDPEPGGTPHVRTVALRKLLDAYLSLSTEALSYRDPPVLEDPPYPPIVIYPRLTAPALLEPTDVRTDHGVVSCWMAPIVVNRDALFWDLSPETVWFGRSKRRLLFHEPFGHVSSYLVPHGETRLDARRPVHIEPYLHHLEPLDVTLSDGSTYSLPTVGPRRAGGVFVLPVDNADGVTPGFYDVQMFPKVPVDTDRLKTAWGRSVGDALRRGAWYEVLDGVRAFPGARAAGGGRAVERDLLTMAEGIEAFIPTRFDPLLDPIQHAFQRWSWRAPDPVHADSLVPDDVVCALGRLLTRSHQPVPMLLEAPGTSADPFTFVAAGDLQFHDERTHLHRFLRLIDAHGDGQPSELAHLLPPDVQARLRDVKFVVIAGDLGDGAGLSSTPAGAIVAGLGLTPPLAPYDKEFPFVRDELERARVPFFAVPGNHDGFATYGGLLNAAFDISGAVLKAPPDPVGILTYPLGHGLQQIGRYMPVLVKVGRLSRYPYFDGLVRWQYEFGPLNSAFTFRGVDFIAFNSYHLPALYRDQIGSIANNWGGGVEPADALWFDVMTRRRRRGRNADGAHQFVFMHHDPRAAVPELKGAGHEVGYGAYDAADAPFNALTFGWLGTNYSTLNPLFIPIITPVGSNLWRLATTGDRFNQEWMGTVWGDEEDCHNAQSLATSINENLAREGGAGGISHVFYAHNDVPAEGTWAETDNGRIVFRPPACRDWSGCPNEGQSALAPLIRLRTKEPFAWGRDMRAPEGRNAAVHRVDDLGDNGSDVQGFHLVTVYPNPGGEPVIEVTPVRIPKPPTVPRLR